jgi:uncharacterized protein YndB with AHSA1/START domain
MDFEITETAVVSAPPEAVFDLITDIGRLPEWNREIRAIHEQPATLTPGAEWAVEIHAMGTHWPSRSTVVDCDRAVGVFAYRSQSDDGNPSYGDWLWEVRPHAHGTEVRVHLSAHPRTFWRRYLLSNLRRAPLRKAVRKSLQSLTNERTFA